VASAGPTPKREIADAAFRYQHELESGLRKVVSVNCYTEGDDAETATLKIDPAFETDKVQRLRDVRERREAKAAAAALQDAAREPKKNLMARLPDAARADATEGEMVQGLQCVFGAYSETPTF